jgi:putative membrane protein
MYKPMTDGTKDLDFSVIVPLGIGGLLIVLALSKLFDFIFEKAYAGMFHFILGVVFASTVMIIPMDYNYLSAGTLVCVVTCAAGVLLGLWMSKLEEKYK